MADSDNRAIVSRNDIVVAILFDLPCLRGGKRPSKTAACPFAEEIDKARLRPVLLAVGNHSIYTAQGDAALLHTTVRMVGAAGTQRVASVSVVGRHDLQLPENGKSASDEACPIPRGLDIVPIHP